MKKKAEEGPAGFWCLSVELGLHVFSFLGVEDLSRVALACQAFNEIASDDSLWKPLGHPRWKAKLQDSPRRWKDLYIEWFDEYMSITTKEGVTEASWTPRYFLRWDVLGETLPKRRAFLAACRAWLGSSAETDDYDPHHGFYGTWLQYVYELGLTIQMRDSAYNETSSSYPRRRDYLGVNGVFFLLDAGDPQALERMRERFEGLLEFGFPLRHTVVVYRVPRRRGRKKGSVQRDMAIVQKVLAMYQVGHWPLVKVKVEEEETREKEEGEEKDKEKELPKQLRKETSIKKAMDRLLALCLGMTYEMPAVMPDRQTLRAAIAKRKAHLLMLKQQQMKDNNGKRNKRRGRHPFAGLSLGQVQAVLFGILFLVAALLVVLLQWVLHK